ncbi:hypothetical protein GTHT12_02838 [Geobacillus thermodenitrificans]|uniref:glycosyltransferase family 4 protein n=1 Tax=Geobacillus thermodenitrificans TaxID=33940 RepID=UPI000A28E936|nr:glycosyltransferase family 4 protein [Geobacillus thermodenitrificans]ARP44334.1 hypothetical protein GTHT12_02838 [Geobacillus thermodenitrificans]
MKILMSAYACEPNKGSEPGVGWNWSTNMSNYHEIWVITRKNNKESIDKVLKEKDFPNLNFVYYDLPKWLSFWKKGQRGVHLYYILWQIAIFFLAKKLDNKHNFDLVHHVTFNEFRTPGFLFLLNKPFVWGPIGGGQNYNPKFKSIYGGYKVRIKEIARNVINHLAKRNLIFNLALKKAAVVLVADPTTYNFLPKKYRKKYIRMLETGINIIKEENIKREEDNNIFNILWVGNIIPRKGLPILLYSLSKVNSNINYKLTVIGDGSDRERCLELCKNIGISERVKFVGKIPYTEVQKQYNKANIFVFTSLRDTSGNVVLEAMNNRLPVITLDHHGVSEIVDESCGIKIPVLSEEQVINDLAMAIEKLYNDKKLCKVMGENAIKRLKKYYDWNVKAKQMNEVYLSVLKKGEKVD